MFFESLFICLMESNLAFFWTSIDHAFSQLLNNISNRDDKLLPEKKTKQNDFIC
mgnify:CR=1 FL=1